MPVPMSGAGTSRLGGGGGGGGGGIILNAYSQPVSHEDEASIHYTGFSLHQVGLISVSDGRGANTIDSTTADQ